ncbi:MULTISPECIES: nucleotidyltransferase family protein [unclassified Nostoc]|uniref:nucleotidyltransferase family protein n=1 Tax=unclassified Nostoc TaxID=2593658 RepID=UPI0026311B03|nr:nucleotidyltransferase family protein [Nostoc sp. S13]MDF5734217.1 nucleotidyltransferase family protein [Nostoc sp. S13]
MKDWKIILIPPQHSIREAIQTIDVSALQIALVVNEQQQLLGTVTDGDIRRAILKGFSLDEPVYLAMSPQPITVDTNTTNDEIIAMMRRKSIRQIPVIDLDRRVVKLALLEQLLEVTKRDNWVILIAGGLGTRLAPLTHDCPKPLLRVGGKPILENILESFIDCGFHQFFISVNYKSHMIENYFSNGSRWGVKIKYLRETQRLGTAGGLSLLPKRPELPFFVMNADLLTKVNFHKMLNFHQEHESRATMAVTEYDFQIPFGVVDTEQQKIISIREKPLYKFHINTGIYILEPSCLESIPKAEYYDMPSLFETLIQKQEKTSAFPICEYWLDIGRMSDFEKANEEFREVFA